MSNEKYIQQAEAFAEYLLGLPKARRRVDNSVRGRCPKQDHEDKRPSFSYDVEKDAWACSCGSGKGSELRAHLGWVYTNGSGTGFKSVRKERRVTATYDYQDEAGATLFQVVRYDPKDFRQRRMVDGEWLYELGDSRRVPYKLPELLKVPIEQRILVVDGEKDVETAWSLGYPATCAPHGMGSWKQEYGKYLKDHAVTVIADRDGGKGEAQATEVIEKLSRDGIEATLIEMPGENVKDLTDWKEAGGTLDDLALLAEGKPIDWRQHLMARVIDAKDLAHLIDEPIPYLAYPIFVKGSLTQIQGLPKGGKSAFLVYLSICAATGVWPHPDFISSKKGALRVLYVAWEDPDIMMAKRLSLFGQGLGFDKYFMPENLRFIMGSRVFIERDKDCEALKAAITEWSADVVVIDTLSHVHGADENEASSMKVPMDQLDRIAKSMNISVTYSHHTTKGSGDRAAQEKGRGSGTIGAAWHVLIDWQPRENSESNINPVLIQSKYLHHWKHWNIKYEPKYAADANPKVDEPEAVAWGFENSVDESSGKKKEKDSRERVLDSLKELLPSNPEGVPGRTLVEVLSHQGLGKSMVYKVLKELEAGFQISHKSLGNSTLYKLTNL